MKLRPDIKRQAKAHFSEQYGMSLGAYLLYVVIIGAVGWTGVGVLLLMPPLLVGYCFFTLRVYRGEKGDIAEMFNVGFNDYGRSLGGVLWMELFIFLWSLLFFIPGIIKMLSYFMTPFILADCPKVRPTEALKLSMRMTRGHKGKVFVMGLSFIGWLILSGLTGGILQIFFVGPYTSTSFAGLYNELKQEALEKGVVTAAELA